MKVRFKRLLFSFLGAAGYMFPPGKHGIRILYYHSVNPCRKYETNVLPGEFERQIRFLSRRYSVISLESAVEKIVDGDICGNEVVVTFDDGYADNFKYAFPCLRRYGIPATIFLSAGYVETDRILPHDRNDNPEHNGILGWGDVKAMEGGMISFGSHSLSHCRLSSVPPDIMRREVELSYAVLTGNLESCTMPFSYPYGTRLDFSDDVKETVRKTGYFCACSAVYGVNGKDADIYELRRIGIDSSDSIFTFRAKLNGRLDFISFKDSRFAKRVIRKVMA